MQVSKRGLNRHIKKEIFRVLHQLFADIKTSQEAEDFLNDLFSKTEGLALAKRIMIAYYLEHGRSYENIKQNLKVSSATIASVDRKRKSEGYKLALKKIEAEKWADEWAGKIKKFFK